MLKGQLNLPKTYCSLHIRRGNKDIEFPYLPVSRYFEQLDELPAYDTLPVFIASDDHSIMGEIKKMYPKREIYHFNFPDQLGWYKEAFIHGQNVEQQQWDIIRLLAEVEVLVESEYFIGSFTSNVGMFVGMARAGQKVSGTDVRNWIIW